MAEKTENATPKKLKDARKKGQVAKSQDFPSATTFVTSVSVTMFLSGFLFDRLGGFIGTVYARIGDPDLVTIIGPFFLTALQLILTTTLPILVCVVSVGVITGFLVVGPTFAIEVFKPDIKKFDPIKNLKAKFKLKTLVELIKSMAKIFGASILVAWVMYGLIGAIVASAEAPDLTIAVEIMSQYLTQVMIRIAIFFIVVASLDLIYQKAAFAKEMKMEKFELKQEMKNSEGDPQLKGKRKEIAREIAYSAGPAAGVELAKAVITNPTHLAIAVGYEHGKDPAPFIVAMGQNYVAALIIKEAERLEIPVLRNIDLAHHLYDTGTVYEYIPEHTYEAVAEILKWIASLEEESED
jgi:type III secretion protein U